MKFYLILTVNYNDGTKDSKSIYEYENEKELIANFHKNLGGFMLKDNVAHILCMAVNSEGGVHMKEAWTNPIVPIVEETKEEVEEVTE